MWDFLKEYSSLYSIYKKVEKMISINEYGLAIVSIGGLLDQSTILMAKEIYKKQYQKNIFSSYIKDDVFYSKISNYVDKDTIKTLKQFYFESRGDEAHGNAHNYSFSYIVTILHSTYNYIKNIFEGLLLINKTAYVFDYSYYYKLAGVVDDNNQEMLNSELFKAYLDDNYEQFEKDLYSDKHLSDFKNIDNDNIINYFSHEGLLDNDFSKLLKKYFLDRDITHIFEEINIKETTNNIRVDKLFFINPEYFLAEENVSYFKLLSNNQTNYLYNHYKEKYMSLKNMIVEKIIDDDDDVSFSQYYESIGAVYFIKKLRGPSHNPKIIKYLLCNKILTLNQIRKYHYLFDDNNEIKKYIKNNYPEYYKKIKQSHKKYILESIGISFLIDALLGLLILSTHDSNHFYLFNLQLFILSELFFPLYILYRAIKHPNLENNVIYFIQYTTLMLIVIFSL